MGRFRGARTLRSTVKAGRQIPRTEWIDFGGAVSGLTLWVVYPI